MLGLCFFAFEVDAKKKFRGKMSIKVRRVFNIDRIVVSTFNIEYFNIFKLNTVLMKYVDTFTREWWRRRKATLVQYLGLCAYWNTIKVEGGRKEKARVRGLWYLGYDRDNDNGLDQTKDKLSTILPIQWLITMKLPDAETKISMVILDFLFPVL